MVDEQAVENEWTDEPIYIEPPTLEDTSTVGQWWWMETQRRRRSTPKGVDDAD